ncbi:hypothetical protein [Xenorhabdus siamensis]|uniref:hypothetical protein n=1 Tax=Xenorhabdus siamensis TaxID=3136254 RepID=UPI0030F40DFA
MQDAFKSTVADNKPGGLHLSGYWKSEHREQQTLSSQPISTGWENDSINIYVTLSEDGKPIMQINCCCFNQDGITRFTGLLKAKLSSLSQFITI